MSVEQQNKAVLNANTGILNVVPSKAIRNDLQAVADRIFNILKDHYGPFSGFAAIESGEVMAETKYTKDGIEIVRALEFASPQEDWVKKTVAYIGNSMETTVGDGTTSSMMFTCAMIRHMLDHIDEIKPISYMQLRNVWDTLVTDLKDHIDINAVKVDEKTDRDLIKAIVFNQVYTSSHGDTELARALAEVYAKTPQPLWNRMVYERRRYETDDRFTIQESAGQFSMNCEVMMTGMLNTKMCTEYEATNARLIVMNDTIRMDSFMYDKINEAIQQATPEHPLVVVSHKRMAMTTLSEFMPILDKAVREDHPVAIFQIDPPNPSTNDFVALMLIGGLTLKFHGKAVADDCYLDLDNVKVTFKNHLLTLDNLYKDPEGWDKNERSLLTDGKSLQFTDYVETVKSHADYMAKQKDNPDSQQEATRLYRLYSKMLFTRTSVLQIGGNSIDNIAYTSVVDDSIRAASRALTYGVVLGNNKALYHSALTEKNILEQMHREVGSIRYWFVCRILESLEDIAMIIPERVCNWTPKWLKNRRKEWCDRWFATSVNLIDFCNTSGEPRKVNTEPWPFFCHQPSRVTFTTDLIDQLRKVGTKVAAVPYSAIITQPANSDISMLERFGEIALKYVTTERIIVHGTAYIDPKRKTR